MTFLLDTQAFLWSAMAASKLPASIQQILKDTENEICVSAVCFWEISIKYALGKLDLKNVRPGQMPEVATEMRFVLQALDPLDAASYWQLPKTLHKDPFDRMLVWQSIRQNWTLVSRDRELTAYEPAGLKLVLF